MIRSNEQPRVLALKHVSVRKPKRAGQLGERSLHQQQRQLLRYRIVDCCRLRSVAAVKPALLDVFSEPGKLSFP